MKKFACITINNNHIYGALLYKKDSIFHVEKSHAITINGSLEDALTSMVSHFDDDNDYDRIEFGIVNVSEPLTKVIKNTNGLSHFEISQQVRRKMPEYSFADKPDYSEDFMLCHVDDEEYIYIVGLPTEDIQKVATPILKSGHKLSLVDYWMFPMTCNQKKPTDSLVSIIETENGIDGYLWWHKMLIGHLHYDEQLEPAEFIKQLLSIDPEQRCNTAPIQLAINSHTGAWKMTLKGKTLNQKLPIELDNSHTHAMDYSTPYWQAIVGMANRMAR